MEKLNEIDFEKIEIYIETNSNLYKKNCLKVHFY